jgi:BREX system ATP-binding protein BrxC/D
VDEVEQIARLRTYMNRDRALQTLREFVDNTDGDIGLQYIALYFAATPAMFDDEKYFRSYDALATRIEPVSKEINWRSPVIDLEKTMLSRKQLSWVASRIRWIYGLAYGSTVSNGLSATELENLVDVVDQSRYRVAKPRLLCRVVMDALDRLRQGGTIGKAEQMVSDTAAALARDQEA